MKFFSLLLAGAAALATTYGCSMTHAWKSIPPPGGCDQCHQGVISSEWRMKVEPVKLTDAQGRLPFQRPEITATAPPDHASSERRLEQQSCFTCHSEPDLAHRELKGNYHQQAK